MDILHNLTVGFGAAASLQNLLFCLIGCLLGTLIGVLPGSKHEAYDNLPVIFDVIKALALRRRGMLFAFALSRALELEKILAEYSLKKIPTFVGLADAKLYSTYGLSGYDAEIIFAYDIFGDVINESKAVIGISGTGNEQAAGMGKPVFGFWGKGPQITKKFMQAQKRLLGPSLILSPPDPGLIAERVARMLDDQNALHEIRNNGIMRMEGRGSISLLAQDIARYMSTVKGNEIKASDTD